MVGVVEKAKEVENDLFVAIGNAETRKRLMNELAEKKIPVLIHPNAVVSLSATIGRGTVVMAAAVINPDVKIGQGCIVNTSSSIDHDCTIEDYSHVSIGAHLAGTVNIGDFVWIGAGSTISNNVNICSNFIVGAGAVAIHDIEEDGTYICVPAKVMSKHNLTWRGDYSTRLIE